MQVIRLRLPRPASLVQSSRLQVVMNSLMLTWEEFVSAEELTRESMIRAISRVPIYWAESTSPLIFDPVYL